MLMRGLYDMLLGDYCLRISIDMLRWKGRSDDAVLRLLFVYRKLGCEAGTKSR